MRSMTRFQAAVLASLGLAAAHGGVFNYTIGGVDYPG